MKDCSPKIKINDRLRNGLYIFLRVGFLKTVEAGDGQNRFTIWAGKRHTTLGNIIFISEVALILLILTIYMVPKPFFDDGLRSSTSFSSTEEDATDGGKVKQKVLGLFGQNTFIPQQEGLVVHEFMKDHTVLLQSIQNYRKIALAGFKDFPEDDSQVLQDPHFGEQVIVDAHDEICLGDIYEIMDSTLKIRVTAPRKMTRELDVKNKTPVGVDGICHLTCSTAMAGWLCEVLCKGTMGEGSELVLVDRPLAKWTLPELAKAIYGGEGDPKLYYRRKPSWGRSKADLAELLALPYMAESGWKDKLRKIQRQEKEKLLPTPYFDNVVEKNDRAVASVLGVYGRAEDTDEAMPRAQVPQAFFEPVQGIKGHQFWHLDQVKNPLGDRAILLQSIQAYRRMQEENLGPFPDTDMAVLIDPCFGEQVILDIRGDICLGDVFGVQGSTLKLRVTSPRKPCSEVDIKNDVAYGLKGLRHFACSKALAGWFCEVLTEGSMTKGSIFELLERPNPQWTIEEIAMAVYGGEGDPGALRRGTGSWGRPIEQLHELLAIPYFSDVEWKDEMRKMEKRSNKSSTSAGFVYGRKHSDFLLRQNAWIPVIFAFTIATISCLMVVASEY